MVDFSGFSADSFEQFIRALAVKLVGPGVTVFGDGPDGGREATFSGKVLFPHPPHQQWDGYGVFQAKFKSTNEGSSKDQAWAISQAKAELEKWLSSPKRRPRAEYFVFCTNVSLSSASGGGKDKLQKLMSLKKYGLKGHAVWDLNQLRSYIDSQSELRGRFRAFFTTGDLLAAFADTLKTGDGVDAEAVLTNYIAREFLADEDARLSQAGDRSEDRIRLADVFVDLPSGPEPLTDPVELEDDGLLPASLSELLRAGAYKLDPLALLEEGKSRKDNAERAATGLIARFVYLGGPGSGKSTIGQVLAQIHRAALLHRRPIQRLEERVASLVGNIKTRCEKDGYVWPQTPRYPFRVELNHFAKALSGANDTQVNSLSEYLRQSLSKNTPIEHVHLRSWLASYPWLLILDGLDEVPASSNRKQVINAIQDFLNEARDLESDLQIVASSRPDGYAGEFDGGEVAHRHLHPLSAQRAILCAEKYVYAKIGKKDDHRAEAVMTTLRTSIVNPLIAKLMYSPLQVTFMVTVVGASGKPSESRWRLFSEYYKTIYERELQKAVPPFDKALSARRSDIDALHHRVGFILQNRAESSGGTQSDISLLEFKTLVRECLGELGLTNQVLEHEVDMIVGAANQRLVFLTSRTPGRLSFDVRSLQEYMAAACLTNSDSTEVMPRLMRIGHSAYWRNVTMFSIGRFFDEPQLRNQREKIRLFCEDLNTKNTQFQKGLIGSRLAVDVLRSGVMGDVPAFSRALGKIALGLLEFPTDEDGDQNLLSAIYKPEMEAEYKSAVSLRLGQIETDRSVAAWWLLNQLIDSNVSWAGMTWEAHWPKDTAKQKAIFASFFQRGASPQTMGAHLLAVATALIPQLAPSEVMDFLGTDLLHRKAASPAPEWLTALVDLFNRAGSATVKVYHDDKSVGIDAFINKVNDTSKASYARLSTILAADQVNPSWLPIAVIAKFVMNPTRDAFIAALDGITATTTELQFWRKISPWPLVQATYSTESKEALLALNKDAKPWVTTEESFSKVGLELKALFAPTIELHQVAVDAITSWGLADRGAAVGLRTFLKTTLDALEGCIYPERKIQLSRLFAGLTSILENLQEFDPDIIDVRVLQSSNEWNPASFSLKVSPQEKVSPAWERFFIRFSQRANLLVDFPLFRSPAVLLWFLQKYSADTKQLGFLKLAGLAGTFFSQNSATKALNNCFDLSRAVNGTDDELTKFAAVAIELIVAGGDGDRIRYASSVIRSLLKSSNNETGVKLILRVVERNHLQRSCYNEVVDVIIDSAYGKSWDIRAQAEAVRVRLIEGESSGYTQEILVLLGLPQGHIRESD